MLTTKNPQRSLAVYLAGPDVFCPDQEALFTKRKVFLIDNGFLPLCPMDNQPPAELRGREIDRAIYMRNIEILRAADLVLANVNNFRGVGVDDGTAFEIGAAAALGKTIFGFRDDLVPMHERCGRADGDGCVFEAFGNAINLMLENSIFESGGALVCGSFEDAVSEAVKWRARGGRGVSKPKIVCLAGSTRFFREFQRAACEAELAGDITVGPAFTPDVEPNEHGGTVGITQNQKVVVDAAFVHKIEMADEVLVINPGGYVGESTRRDIAFARALGKPIRWLDAEHAFGGGAQTALTPAAVPSP